MLFRRSFVVGTVVMAALGASMISTTGCSGKSSCCGDSCACGTEAKAAARHKISDTDSGKTLSVAVGETIEFSAVENPSTGYQWAATTDSALIETGDSKYTGGNDDPNIVGAPGTRTMQFKAKAAGTSILTLRYVRSWQANEPAKEVNVKIEAK